MDCGVLTRIEETYRQDAKFAERKERKESRDFQAFSRVFPRHFLAVLASWR